MCTPWVNKSGMPFAPPLVLRTPHSSTWMNSHYFVCIPSFFYVGLAGQIYCLHLLNFYAHPILLFFSLWAKNFLHVHFSHCNYSFMFFFYFIFIFIFLSPHSSLATITHNFLSDTGSLHLFLSKSTHSCTHFF